MEGVITSQKSANATIQGPILQSWLLKLLPAFKFYNNLMKVSYFINENTEYQSD